MEVEEAPDLILRVHTSSRLKALLRYDDIPEMTTWTTQKHPHALLHIFLRLRMVLQVHNAPRVVAPRTHAPIAPMMCLTASMGCVGRVGAL